jgi:hypothetical protein
MVNTRAMRSFEIFAGMTPDHATAMVGAVKKAAPGMHAQALAIAAAAFKARPVYLARQPLPKQASAIRRALSRVAANLFAEEMLAVYFLECKKDLLIEWLDSVGVAHEDGTLTTEEPKAPSKKKLEAAAKAFRGAGDDPDRALLLAAFAAQDAIDWPALDALIDSPA